jgi:hypothetical protein
MWKQVNFVEENAEMRKVNWAIVGKSEKVTSSFVEAIATYHLKCVTPNFLVDWLISAHVDEVLSSCPAPVPSFDV